MQFNFSLWLFLQKNSSLSVHQSGFRKKHSTETAPVFFVDHILEQMDKQRINGSIFIDLKKAFDLVDHHCLPHKLEHYRIRGNSQNTSSQIQSRRLIQFNYRLWGPPRINTGPDFVCLLSLLKSSIRMYADDTVIYFSGSCTEIIKQVLQTDLNNVEKWLASNRFELNQNKT